MGVQRGMKRQKTAEDKEKERLKKEREAQEAAALDPHQKWTLRNKELNWMHKAREVTGLSEEEQQQLRVRTISPHAHLPASPPTHKHTHAHPPTHTPPLHPPTHTHTQIAMGKGDEGEAGPSGDKSTFHGKAEDDSLGRSWLEAPKDRKNEAEAGCYLPKKVVASWTGHQKGVQAVRFFPGSGHLLLTAGMDGKVRGGAAL